MLRWQHCRHSNVFNFMNRRLLAVKIPRAHARMSPILMPIKDKFATYAVKVSLTGEKRKYTGRQDTRHFVVHLSAGVRRWLSNVFFFKQKNAWANESKLRLFLYKTGDVWHLSSFCVITLPAKAWRCWDDVAIKHCWSCFSEFDACEGRHNEDGQM